MAIADAGAEGRTVVALQPPPDQHLHEGIGGKPGGPAPGAGDGRRREHVRPRTQSIPETTRDAADPSASMLRGCFAWNWHTRQALPRDIHGVVHG